ncbi:MAG: M42 family metallopeptidase [Planctomycetota bacterium]
MTDLRALRELIDIDSPTGMTDAACDYVQRELQGYGLEAERTKKGAVRCALGPSPRVAVAAHVDTLGAVISKIRDDGRLTISPVGGLSLNMAEGEYVRIHTLAGQIFTGTFLLNDPSAHANKGLATTERNQHNMHVRLDELVSSDSDVRSLGIRVGDFVCFSPRYEELESGFIKSRFLDNKAGCFTLFEVARRLRESGREVPAELFFSTYEEVGHGGTCGYSDGIEELLVIDMGVIGNACQGDETKCSICAKDSSGPYDYAMRKRLVSIAESKGIEHAIDVYPYYGSDGSAALRAGNDFRVGLIGPGVAASHGVERTHRRGIDASIELTLAYLLEAAS